MIIRLWSEEGQHYQPDMHNPSRENVFRDDGDYGPIGTEYLSNWCLSWEEWCSTYGWWDRKPKEYYEPELDLSEVT